MASPDVLMNDKVFNGKCSFGQSINFASASIPNSAIEASANIDASKLVVHRSATHEFANVNTNPAATTHTVIHITNAKGKLLDFKACWTGSTVASTNDEVGVNLYRSAAGGAWATVLSDTVVVSTHSIRIPVTGSFANTTIADEDVFSVTCTVSSTVSGKGLVATMTWEEFHS